MLLSKPSKLQNFGGFVFGEKKVYLRIHYIKMLKILLQFFLLMSYLPCMYSQIPNQFIYMLAADSLEGRAPASISEAKTLFFLTNQLQNICDTVYTQPFCFTYKTKTDTTQNLIAFQNNHQPKTIIFMAHYDHLGWGNAKSREIINKHQIHNGADDNASGVAMLLQLANTLSQKDTSFTKYNYVYLFTSAHELGLFGANHFLTTADYSHLSIRAVLNFDMVGRLNIACPILKIGGKETDTTFQKIFNEIKSPFMQLRFADEQLLASDATPFYEKKLPTLTFTTGIHNDYHRASDDADKINYEGMSRIFAFVVDLLRYLASQ